ncbi:class I SAM-dependent methyltransferase [candidate division KSB1 bacterium]|nr:MAG: class I SAM-dependent methyltransferase [candidate division KSB1 bacterium]
MSDEPVIFPPLFYEVFGNLPRQGPGGDAYTLKALSLIPNKESIRDILDVGCGSGAPTMVLARNTTANIVALDNCPPFLETLQKTAQESGFDKRIRCVNGDMSKPEFAPDSFDLIWSEGAIACVGFEQGLKIWKPLLRANGCVAVTDLCWFTENPPKEIYDYLTGFYPGMMSAAESLKAVERAGYRLLNHFSLPKESWAMEYFAPLEVEIERQRPLHANDTKALELLDALQFEADMYKKYSDHYGYAFFIAQKI